MTDYVTRTLSIVVLPDGEPIFNRAATTVSIADDGGGEFVVVEQIGDGSDDYHGKLAISPEDWPVIREAIDRMLGELHG